MGITGREGIDGNKVCSTCKWGKCLDNGSSISKCKGCKDGSDWEPDDTNDQKQRLSESERKEILKIIEWYKNENSRLKSENFDIIHRHMIDTSRYKLELFKSQENVRRLKKKLDTKQRCRTEETAASTVQPQWDCQKGGFFVLKSGKDKNNDINTTSREGTEEDKVCDTCKWDRYKMTGLVTPCNGGCGYSDWEPEDSCNAVDGLRPKVPAFSINDSGNRREFDTGAVRDMAEGKGRMDLLPWTAIMEVSKHCERGAEKYGEHNVDKGIPVHSFIDSAARHLGKYIEG